MKWANLRSVPFFTYLDPASTDPDELVNRDELVSWLRRGLDGYLRGSDKSRRRAFPILGDKGVGKSIVVRKVIDELRELHAATTLFLEVDCRRWRDQRRVYGEIARQAVDQLARRADVDEALLATARVLETIAKYDSVERKVIHEHLVQHKAAINLRGKQVLVGFLGASYDISLQRGRESRERMEGSVLFDAPRLREAVVGFFEDLRVHANFDVVLLLDNIDELDHEAIRTETERDRLRGETDGLLGLAHAPIGLILTMRTYFAGILSREVDDPKYLARMPAREHVAIIERRLQREPEEVQAAFADAACRGCIAALAKLAPTPLALLKWFRYLAERELHASPDVRAALRQSLHERYAQIGPEWIEKVATKFEAPNQAVSREALLAACNSNESTFAQLERYQVILPLDWWQPYEYTLDPELHFLVGAG